MTLPELTYEEFCALPLTYSQGLRAHSYAIRQYNNYEHKFGKEVNTPFNERNWTWGKPTVVYFMHDDKRNFDTPDQLDVAYMEKVCNVAVPPHPPIPWTKKQERDYATQQRQQLPEAPL